MEELKLLIEMVANLPTLAVWVLAAYLFYKLAVVGSVYGVIRFGIAKLHDYLITRATAKERQAKEVDITATINGMCITRGGAHNALIAQLERVRNKGTSLDKDPFSRGYIHDVSVLWLREAIDAKEKEDRENEKTKN